MNQNFKITYKKLKKIIDQYKVCTFIVVSQSITQCTSNINPQDIEKSRSFIAFVDLILNSMKDIEAQLIRDKFFDNKDWESRHYLRTCYYKHFTSAMYHFMDLYTINHHANLQ